MKPLFLLILFSSIIFNNSISSQVLRETRAVWVTTNFKLDWPPNTYDENNQKEALRNIFKDIRKKNFNTVYFQVRSNGSVLYKSDIEPFVHYLTGNIGQMPNYDPLQYAIDLGKEYNLEVHAWVNMIRCFSGTDDAMLKHPKHIRNKHPEWTERVMSEGGNLSYWINPGLEESQKYLVNLLLEITNNYEIDGIHLDFFRYPDKKFNDDVIYTESNVKYTRDEWRRKNLTDILRLFKEKKSPLNKFLKIGATPIGIRKSLTGAIGWEGYSSVYQDTEKWLEENLVDYLTPQIYWGFEKNPKFDVLAKDWVEKSYNKNIVLGLAAYKEDVKPELKKMIKYSRSIGAAGVSFFRYSNISGKANIFFDDVSFPSDMEWKKDIEIESGKIISDFSQSSRDKVLIKWNDTYEGNSKYFRNYVLIQKQKPIKFLTLDKDKIKLKFKRPSKLMYEYQICKLDRLWNFSSSSNNMRIKVPYLEELKYSANINKSPILYKLNDTEGYILISSNSSQQVLLDTFNKENLRAQKLIELDIGMNIIPIMENIKLLQSVRITYADNRIDELSFL